MGLSCLVSTCRGLGVKSHFFEPFFRLLVNASCMHGVVRKNGDTSRVGTE